MTIFRRAACAILLTLSAAAPAAAQGGGLVFGGDGFSIRLQFGERFDPAPIREDRGWRRLGQIELSDDERRNVLRLPDERRFEAIQLCVGRSAANIDRFRIVFNNGGRQDVDVRPRIRAGRCTRVIELQGRNARDIRRIVIRGDAARDRGPQPILTLRGRLTSDDRAGGGGGGGGDRDRPRGRGDMLVEFGLSAGTVRRAADIPGSRRFDQARICIARADAIIDRVRIVFGNGGDQEFRLFAIIDDGTCTPWADLAGRRARDIDRVVLVGRADGDRGPSPVVRFFAR